MGIIGTAVESGIIENRWHHNHHCCIEGEAKRSACHHHSLLTLPANVFCAGDGHFGSGDKRILCRTQKLGVGEKRGEFIFTCIRISATHTASHHRLLSRTCVDVCSVIVYSKMSTCKLQPATSLLARNYVPLAYVLQRPFSPA